MNLLDSNIFWRILGFLVLFWVPVTALVILDLYSFVIIYTAGLTFLMGVMRPYLLIAVYVYFLPMGSLVGTEYNLLGYVGIDEITQIGVLYLFLRFRFNSVPVARIQKWVILALFVIIAYYVYNFSKGIVYGTDFGEDVQSGFYIVKLVIKLVLKYVPLALLVWHLGVDKVRSYVFPAITLSIITIALSMTAVEPLIDMGFDLMENDYAVGEVEGGTVRATGFYNAGGDTNSTAGFMLIALGFFLGHVEKSRKFFHLVPVLSATVVGLFLTASRTGMLILAMILLLYFTLNLNKRNTVKLVSLGAVIFLVISPVIFKAVERFSADSARRALDPTYDARLGYYFIYGEYFIEHPDVLITGYTDDRIWYKRSPHNMFMLMLYNTGLVFPGALLFLLFKMGLWGLRTRRRFNILYALIPFVLIISTVNSEGAGIYLWLMLGAAPYLAARSTQSGGGFIADMGVSVPVKPVKSHPNALPRPTSRQFDIPPRVGR